jgi:hypothetical protein
VGYYANLNPLPADAPFNGAIRFVISHPDWPDLHFSGSILGGPSFANGPVKREQVVNSFGEPSTHIQSEPKMAKLEDAAFGRCWQTETNFSLRYNSGFTNGPLDGEVIYYRGRGLTVHLENDVVTWFVVHDPWTKDSPTAEDALETHERRKDPTSHLSATREPAAGSLPAQ